jgi:hypothetical protein
VISQVLGFLGDYDTVSLIAGELIVIFSWVFENIAKSCLEIDTQHINAVILGTKGAINDITAIDGARATYLLYCSDMIWRVGLLSSIPFSAFAFVILILRHSNESGLVAWSILALLGLMFFTFYLVSVKRSPSDLNKRVWKLPLTYYQFGQLVLSAINILTILVSFHYYS